MNSSGKRKSSRCLICLKTCHNPLNKTGFNSFEIPGAVSSPLLRNDLEKFFVLRQILDIPAEWCEQKFKISLRTSTEGLQKGEIVEEDIKTKEATVGEDCNYMGSWFKVCRSCLETDICDAWNTFQKLLAAQSQMYFLKEKIKGKMRESAKLENYSRFSSNGKGTNIEDEIRAIVVPEFHGTIEDEGLIMKAEIDLADDFINNYEDADDDSNSSDSSYHSDSISETNDSNKASRPSIQKHSIQTLQMKMRKRGRPKKIDKTKYYECVKKRKRNVKVGFHWNRCPLCPAKYKRNDDFKSHLKLHEEKEANGKIDYECKECSFLARGYFELTTHQRNNHYVEPPKQQFCTECKFKCKSWREMKKHMLQIHPGVRTEEELDASRQGQCSVCGRVFSNKRLLAIHTRINHPEILGIEQETVECEECHLRFPNKPALQSHISNTHKRENKYVCDICGKGYDFESKLKRHTETHVTAAAKNHICHLCGCAYAGKIALQRHLKKVHSVHKKKNSNVSDESERQVATKEYKCRYCDLTSPYNVVIKKHLEVHKAEMGHHCTQCGKNYTSDMGLRRHIRINHSSEKVPCPHCSKPFPPEYMKDHVNKFCKLKDVPLATPSLEATVSTTSTDTHETGTGKIISTKSETTEVEASSSSSWIPTINYSSVKSEISYF